MTSHKANRLISGFEVEIHVWSESEQPNTKYGAQTSCPECQTVYNAKNRSSQSVAIKNVVSSISYHIKHKHN